MQKAGFKEVVLKLPSDLIETVSNKENIIRVNVRNLKKNIIWILPLSKEK